MVARESDIGQVNPFMPTESANLTPDLIVWQDIRRAYARFPTPESLDRVAALRLVNEELAKESLVADLFIGGSLAFGQSVEHSDVDVFAVITPEEIDSSRSIIDCYRDSDSFADAIRSPLVGTNWTLRKLHSCYQANLRIGNCSLGLIQEVEFLKEDPRVVRSLAFTHTFSGLVGVFRKSFLEYQWRLSKHPDFSVLPESEREQFIEHLEERQRQLLFYIENPQYCR